MRAMWIAVALLMAALWVACSSTGDFQPIVVDLSKSKAASPTPVAPTATPGIVPAPTSPPPVATPSPLPAPSTSPSPSPVPATPPTPRAEPAAGPESVARAREDAFNRHDLDALAALYAPDARVFEPPDRLRESGAGSIRETYARSFSMAPDARIHVTETMTEGNFAVIRQTQTGAGTSRSSILVLEVRGGRIAKEWILR